MADQVWDGTNPPGGIGLADSLVADDEFLIRRPGSAAAEQILRVPRALVRADGDFASRAAVTALQAAVADISFVRDPDQYVAAPGGEAQIAFFLADTDLARELLAGTRSLMRSDLLSVVTGRFTNQVGILSAAGGVVVVRVDASAGGLGLFGVADEHGVVHLFDYERQFTAGDWTYYLKRRVFRGGVSVVKRLEVYHTRFDGDPGPRILAAIQRAAGGTLAARLRILPATFSAPADLVGTHTAVLDNLSEALLFDGVNPAVSRIELREVQSNSTVHVQGWEYSSGDQELQFVISDAEARAIGATGSTDYVTFQASFHNARGLVAVSDRFVVALGDRPEFPATRGEVAAATLPEFITVEPATVARSVAGLQVPLSVVLHGIPSSGKKLATRVSVEVNGQPVSTVAWRASNARDRVIPVQVSAQTARAVTDNLEAVDDGVDLTVEFLTADGDTVDDVLRYHVGFGAAPGGALTDSEIGDKAFRNPPGNLSDQEKAAARVAIGAVTATMGGHDETARMDAARARVLAEAAQRSAVAAQRTADGKADARTGAEFGARAFQNPPGNLDAAQKAAVRAAIDVDASGSPEFLTVEPPYVVRSEAGLQVPMAVVLHGIPSTGRAGATKVRVSINGQQVAEVAWSASNSRDRVVPVRVQAAIAERISDNWAAADDSVGVEVTFLTAANVAVGDVLGVAWRFGSPLVEPSQDIGAALNLGAASVWTEYSITEPLERGREYRFKFREGSSDRFQAVYAFEGDDYLDLDVNLGGAFTGGSEDDLLSVLLPRPEADGARTLFIARSSDPRKILLRVNADYNVVRLRRLGR